MDIRLFPADYATDRVDRNLQLGERCATGRTGWTRSVPAAWISTAPNLPKGPRKSAARDLAVALRKKNYSVYEIGDALKRKCPLSPTAVREVLEEEGFAPLPRRLDDERPERPRPTPEPIADVRNFSLAPRSFTTRCGGLFLFVPELVELNLDHITEAARLPGSKMIPAAHALRSALALKLWAVERKSHVMFVVADKGLALFSGLNTIPKKSYLSEYSSRVSHAKTTRILFAWDDQLSAGNLFTGRVVQSRLPLRPLLRGKRSHRAPQRVRPKPSPIERPRHLVFDSRLTTYANLGRLDEMGISVITLRRRSPTLRKEIVLLPRSASSTCSTSVTKTPRSW